MEVAGAMMGLDADIARMSATLDAHIESDKMVQTTMMGSLGRIEILLTASIEKSERAVERIHGRVDDEAGKARHASNNVAQLAHSENIELGKEIGLQMKVALDVANDAVKKVGETKIWILSSAVAALLAILTQGWAFIRGH